MQQRLQKYREAIIASINDVPASTKPYFFHVSVSSKNVGSTDEKTTASTSASKRKRSRGNNIRQLFLKPILQSRAVQEYRRTHPDFPTLSHGITFSVDKTDGLKINVLGNKEKYRMFAEYVRDNPAQIDAIFEEEKTKNNLKERERRLAKNDSKKEDSKRSKKRKHNNKAELTAASCASTSSSGAVDYDESADTLATEGYGYAEGDSYDDSGVCESDVDDSESETAARVSKRLKTAASSTTKPASSSLAAASASSSSASASTSAVQPQLRVSLPAHVNASSNAGAVATTEVLSRSEPAFASNSSALSSMPYAPSTFNAVLPSFPSYLQPSPANNFWATFYSLQNLLRARFLLTHFTSSITPSFNSQPLTFATLPMPQAVAASTVLSAMSAPLLPHPSVLSVPHPLSAPPLAPQSVVHQAALLRAFGMLANPVSTAAAAVPAHPAPPPATASSTPAQADGLLPAPPGINIRPRPA